jgi:tetratricopeptide (TPR) repeat protein
MKKNNVLIFLLFLAIITNKCFSQTFENNYSKIITKADSLYKLQKYQNAVNFYQNAFILNNGLGRVFHRYKAAACYSLLHKSDSAFIELEKIANKGNFSNYEMLISDGTMHNLHSDPRWESIIKIVHDNMIKKNN